MARRLLIALAAALFAVLAVPGISFAARASLDLQPRSGSGTTPVTATLRSTSDRGCSASAATFSWDGQRVAVAAVDRGSCTATVSFQPPADHIKPGRHQVSGRFVGARGADSATYTVDGSATSASPSRHTSAAAVPPPPPVVVKTGVPTQAATDAGTKAAAADSGLGVGYILGLLAVLAGAAVAGFALYLVFRDRSGRGNGLTRQFRSTVYGNPAGPGAAGYAANRTRAMPAPGVPGGAGGAAATTVLPRIRSGQPAPGDADEAPPTAVIPRQAGSSGRHIPPTQAVRRSRHGASDEGPDGGPSADAPSSGGGWRSSGDAPSSGGGWRSSGDAPSSGGGWRSSGDAPSSGGGWRSSDDDPPSWDSGRDWNGPHWSGTDDEDRYPPRR